MTYQSMGGFGAFDAARPGCGTTLDDVKYTQRALNALGFTDASNRALTVDGIYGTNTSVAMGKYSVARGLGFIGTTAQGNICKALWDEYAALATAPAGSCPPGQQRVAGMCVPIPSVPGAQPQPQTQPGPSVCPPGQYGTPPICYSLPSIPGVTPTPGQPVGCPPGTQGIPPVCLPVPPIPRPVVEPPEPPKPAPPPSKKGLTRNAKIALGVGGVAAIGLVAALVLMGKKDESEPYTRNFRGKASVKKSKSRKARSKKRGHQSSHIIDIKVGRKVRSYGHATPPKRHRRKGATKPSDYADPEHFKYPVKTYKQTRAALGYFARFKDDYPAKIRRVIRKNLIKAKRRFGIGGKSV